MEISLPKRILEDVGKGYSPQRGEDSPWESIYSLKFLD